MIGFVAIAKHQFELTVREHYEDVYRFAWSLTKAECDAADLTQQAFLRYAKKGDSLLEGKKVKSWLFSVLRNEFIDIQRRKTRFPHVEISPDHDQQTGEATASDKADGTLAMAALQSLPAEFREPLALYYLQGYTYREIAKVLDLPMGTVMSRLSRGKVRLKENFAKTPN